MNSASLSGACCILLALGCSGGASDHEKDPLGQARASIETSIGPGMGATVVPGAVRFRVWAPYAKQVYVAGDFNAWSMSSTPLAAEGNGNFVAEVPDARAGQKYKYVIHSAAGDKIWRTDPRAQQVENSIGAGIIHDPNTYTWKANGSTPQFHEQVLYELHVGTFNDEPGGGPGTWKSASKKLDHLVDLGVNMIAVMPIAEFPGDESWGYNPSFPFAPESAYGTPEDFKAFIDEAHTRGIGVILDIVHNHYGPTDLSLWCFDGECLGHGGPYFYTDWRARTPWGDTRPDYGRNQVRDYIRDSAQQWLGEYRLDGLRWDATKFMRTATGDNNTSIPNGYSLLQYINDDSKRLFPWKILIAEDFGGGNSVSQSTISGGMGFDSQWDGAFVHPIRDALRAGRDEDRSMWRVRDSIVTSYNGQGTQRVIYTESHDECANGKSRVPEMIAPGRADSWAARKRSALGTALVLTSPGIPMLFQGQEFLEWSGFDGNTPIDWSKATTYSTTLNLYRDLVHLRRNWHNSTRGLSGNNTNVHHVNDSGKVIAFHRWMNGGAGDDVIVVANFSNQSFGNYTIGVPRAGAWHVRFNSDSRRYSDDFGNFPSFDTSAESAGQDGMPFRANVGIGPYSTIILSQ